MNDDDLIASTRELARKSNGVEAELLLYLGEIDARKIYRERASPSMIAFCMREFNFSEGAAAYRIHVARFARELPAILDALRSGAVHLSGLRVLVPHLNAENHQRVLAQAAGKSKREIEELAAALSPQPPAPDIVRKLPNRELVLMAQTAAAASRVAERASTCRRASLGGYIQDRIYGIARYPRQASPSAGPATSPHSQRQSRPGLRQGARCAHREVLKERFAVGRKGRRASAPITSASHEAPDPMKREVYERDEGRCAFVAEDGTRCPETGFLEIDHIDGFARTHVHDRDRSRLLCRTHNQLSAEQLYGREFMERLRQERKEAKAAARPPPSQAPEALLPTRPGACAQQQLF